ncbi:MAG: hypothetical protein UHM85_04050 [Acutalibacteraceae bacterium]|nr:hypothetical protein [Acutalibacteraceae bacterium]
MKKTVKPSPWVVILFGIMALFCLVLTISGFITGNTTVFPEILIDLVVVGAFIWLLLKYLSQEKIFYDENSFTVGEKTYGYEDITNVIVDSEQIIRSVSTLRIKVYIGEEEICSFTKDDKGGKDFIAVLKNNDVTVNIDV